MKYKMCAQKSSTLQYIMEVYLFSTSLSMTFSLTACTQTSEYVYICTFI